MILLALRFQFDLMTNVLMTSKNYFNKALSFRNLPFINLNEVKDFEN